MRPFAYIRIYILVLKDIADACHVFIFDSLKQITNKLNYWKLHQCIIYTLNQCRKYCKLRKYKKQEFVKV